MEGHHRTHSRAACASGSSPGGRGHSNKCVPTLFYKEFITGTSQHSFNVLWSAAAAHPCYHGYSISPGISLSLGYICIGKQQLHWVNSVTVAGNMQCVPTITFIWKLGFASKRHVSISSSGYPLNLGISLKINAFKFQIIVLVFAFPHKFSDKSRGWLGVPDWPFPWKQMEANEVFSDFAWANIPQFDE